MVDWNKIRSKDEGERSNIQTGNTKLNHLSLIQQSNSGIVGIEGKLSRVNDKRFVWNVKKKIIQDAINQKRVYYKEEETSSTAYGVSKVRSRNTLQKRRKAIEWSRGVDFIIFILIILFFFNITDFSGRYVILTFWDMNRTVFFRQRWIMMMMRTKNRKNQV